MRLLIDSLIALMLVGILAGIVIYHQRQTRQLQRYQEAHTALAQLHEQAIYRGALRQTPTTPHGFPTTISPLWFEGNLPLNALVPGRHPWLDLAPPGDMNDHPPDPVCSRPEQAGFWYNPNRGIFRARVADQRSERLTLTQYNRINGTYLKELPLHYDATRRPEAMQLARLASISGDGAAPEAQHDDSDSGKPRRSLGFSLPAQPVHP